MQVAARSLHVRRRRAIALAATLALGAVPTGAGAATPLGAADVRVRETGFARGDDQLSRAQSRIDIRTGLGSLVKPATFSVQLGGFSAEVPLRHGKFAGRVAAAPIETTARVRTRGRVISATFKLRTKNGGAVLGDRVARRAADEQVAGGLMYDLEAGSVAVDGVSTPIVLSAVARFDLDPKFGLENETPGPGSRFRADVVVGAAIAQLSPPAIQVVPSLAGEMWKGRVRGCALSVGAAPRVATELSGRSPRLVPPLDDEARDLAVVDAVSPGVKSIEVGGTTYFQLRFDTAVQSAPGPQKLLLRAFDARGNESQAVVKFEAPAVAPPLGISMSTHVLEVRRDQTLWAWGSNLFGEVGDGTRLDPVSPVPLAEPAAVRQVCAGGDFSLALDTAGDVWLWGEWNATRDLEADVSVTTDLGGRTPERVADLTGIMAIAAGEDHLLALDALGEVWAMGENWAGQLGDGTFDDHARRPQHVTGLPVIREIAAGEISLALDEDGAVWTWGEQFLAGIGDGTRPVRVAGLPPIRTISAGSNALCLAEDGTVWTWGRNSEGALGDRTDVDRNAPVQVTDLAGVVAIDAGDFHSLAIRGDGTVWAWGYNGYGELGDGTSTDRWFPVRVLDLEGITSIAAGSFQSLAVDGTGAVWAFGRHDFEVGAVGSGGEEYGVYPMLARREFVPGHFPRAAIVVFPGVISFSR